MPRPKPFRILAKNYFITYPPHCALSLEQALSQLQNLNTPPVNKKFIRVCREKHDDGDYHLHVLIQFEGKYVCTNPRFFDLISPSRSAHYHPNNIQGAKSSSDVKSFIEKDGGEFLDWGEFQIDGRSSRGGGRQQRLDKVYASVLNANSKTEALQIIKEGDPKHFFRHYRRLDSNLGEHFAETPATFVPKWNPSSFKVPDSWQQWVSKNIANDAAARPHRPKSIIIEGPSGLGKTEWARSLGPHNYLSGRLDFIPKTFRNDVAYNVIDNVAPKNLARKYWKKLIGSNYDWQADCKYSKPVLIKGGIPSIVLCNPGRDSSYKEFLDKEKSLSLKNWTLLNAEFYFIDNPIFSTEPEGLIIHEQRPTRV